MNNTMLRNRANTTRYPRQTDVPGLKIPHISDNLPADCDVATDSDPVRSAQQNTSENCSYASQSALVIVGKIYFEQLPCCKLSLKGLLFLSLINSLCSRSWAKMNDGAICMGNRQIAEFSNGLFSEQAVNRYLHTLKQAGIIKVCTKDKKRWIYPLHDKKKYIPIVTDCRNALRPSDTLVLSFLLNKAAFYARGGIGFYVDNAQMKSLFTELASGFGITRRSITLSLNRLHELGYFTYEIAPDKYTIIKPIIFTPRVAEVYKLLLNIRPSRVCSEQVHNKAIEQFFRKTGDFWLREQYKQTVAINKSAKEQKIQMKPFMSSACNLQGQTVPERWTELMQQVFGQDAAMAGKTFELTAEQKVQLIIRTPSTGKYVPNKFKKGKTPPFRRPLDKAPARPDCIAAPVYSRQPDGSIFSAAGSAGSAGHKTRARKPARAVKPSARRNRGVVQATATVSAVAAAGINGRQSGGSRLQEAQNSTGAAQPAPVQTAEQAQAVQPQRSEQVQASAAEAVAAHSNCAQPGICQGLGAQNGICASQPAQRQESEQPQAIQPVQAQGSEQVQASAAEAFTAASTCGLVHPNAAQGQNERNMAFAQTQAVPVQAAEQAQATAAGYTAGRACDLHSAAQEQTGFNDGFAAQSASVSQPEQMPAAVATGFAAQNSCSQSTADMQFAAETAQDMGMPEEPAEYSDSPADAPDAGYFMAEDPEFMPPEAEQAGQFQAAAQPCYAPAAENSCSQSTADMPFAAETAQNMGMPEEPAEYSGLPADAPNAGCFTAEDPEVMPPEAEQAEQFQAAAQPCYAPAAENTYFGTAGFAGNCQADVPPAMMQPMQAQPVAAEPAFMPEQTSAGAVQAPESVSATGQTAYQQAAPAEQPAPAAMVQPAGQAGEYGIDQAIAAIGALAASALEGASFRQLAELPKEYLQIATDFVSKEQHNYEFIFTKNDICQIALNAYKFIEEKKGDNEVSRRAIAMRVVCEIPRFALYKRARIKAGDPHYPDQKVVIDLQGNSCSLRDFLNQYDQSMEELTKNGKEFVLSYQTFYGIVSSTLKRELQKYGKTPHLIMIRYIALKMYLIAACKRPVLLHSCSYQQAFEQLLCDMCANPAMDLEKAIYLLKP